MSFVELLVQNSMDIWDQCLSHPFIQALADDSLSEAQFKNYMIQDSIYLKEYAKVYAAAMFKADTLQEIRMYYSILGFVTEHEGAARIAYLKEHGITEDDLEYIPALPENQAYTDYMLSIAKQYGQPEILMAALPCTLSYFYIFHTLFTQNPHIQNSPYWPILQEYASDGYEQACHDISVFTEALCAPIQGSRREKLLEIFRTSSLHELHFWDMAYRAQ